LKTLGKAGEWLKKIKKKVNVAVIGARFMGKAHSNAWLNVARFFDLPYEPVLKMICSRDGEDYNKNFAENWGYAEHCDDWHKAVDCKDIDIIDICTPPFLHKEITIAAVEAGKHILCEKPVAMNYHEAYEMAEAADKAGVLHYLNHNYRRVPAVALAKNIIDEGKLGEIYHWRGAYLQDWAMDASIPLTWQLTKELAGAGSHYDLASHSVDLARFLVGEVKSIQAMLKTFITERVLPGESEKGQVSVDDASFMTAEFENGAIGSFDISRMMAGRKNYNYFEVYGSKGSLVFNLENMNSLQYFNADDPQDLQGYREIPATLTGHPYMSAWWPPGHIIGYEHVFSHAVKDFLDALAGGNKIEPNLWDGVKIMQTLDAAILSDKEGRRVNVSEVK